MQQVQHSNDPESTSEQLEIAVTQIDIAALLELIEIDGLTGTGTPAGEFPLYLEGDAVEVRDAKLVGDAGGGTLRYRPSGGASATAVQAGQLGLVVELLENFRHERLVIVLNGMVNGDVQAAIHLSGAFWRPVFRIDGTVQADRSVQQRRAEESSERRRRS